MSRSPSKARPRDRGLEGLLVVRKPRGMTSHDVVSRARRALGMRRIGHAGTLDPMATGVLVLLVGKATKLFAEFEAFDKTYEARLVLGVRTSTADMEGEVLERREVPELDEAQIRGAMDRFIGDIDQVPPMVSAVKHKGKRLYQLARKGIEVERKPRRIRIRTLELLDFHSPEVTFRVACSKGTYVRQLAEDLAGALGTVGCIDRIERTRVGPFDLTGALNLEAINDGNIRSWPAA